MFKQFRHPGKFSLRAAKENLSGTQSAARQELDKSKSTCGTSDWVPEKFTNAKRRLQIFPE